MKAKYDNSICGLCQQKIAKGSEIQKHNEKWCHKDCIDARSKKPNPEKSKNKKESLASLQDLEKAELESQERDKKLKVDSPMFETEILVKHYRNISYKIVYAGIENINSLSSDDIRSHQIERNMLTKILLNTDLKLREINGIKSVYYMPKK